MAWRHGTVYGYQQGCRCDECRAAVAERRREQRDRARAANSASYQRDLATSRRLKELYRGKCIDCGGATSWGGGSSPGAGPSERCAACRKVYERTVLKVWTAETVIAAMRRWADAHDGRAPTAIEWMHARDGYPAAATVYSHSGSPFGSWGEALEAAGFPRPRQGQRPGAMWWTEAVVVTELQRLATDGVAPSAAVEHTLAQMARQFYGTWEAACDAAGLTARSRMRTRPVLA